MKPRPPAPNPDTALVDWPWVLVRFRCHYCERQRDSRLSVLVWKFGLNATVRELVALFRRPCPWRHDNLERRPQKYGHKCGAHCPDVGRVGPPDLPPSMSGLRLIDGGRDDMLPAEPAEPARRWRRCVISTAIPVSDRAFRADLCVFSGSYAVAEPDLFQRGGRYESLSRYQKTPHALRMRRWSPPVVPAGLSSSGFRGFGPASVRRAGQGPAG